MGTLFPEKLMTYVSASRSGPIVGTATRQDQTNNFFYLFLVTRKVNSCFDYYNASGAIQPQYWETLEQFYSRYLVKYSKNYTRIENQSDDSFQIAEYYDDNATDIFTDNWDTRMNLQPHLKKQYLSPQSGPKSIGHFNTKIYQRRFQPLTSYVNLFANMNAEPTGLVYLHMACMNMSGNNTTGLVITQNVTFKVLLARQEPVPETTQPV